MTRVADPLSPASWPVSLQRAFENLPPVAWTVALSGGLDSVVLLHLALAWQRQRLQPHTLRAIHVNHGLQSQSNSWASVCQQICDRLAVPLDIVPVAVQGDSGKGLEDAARDARYAAFERNLRSGEALLLGHHADDQAETQLYRMMRGSGLAGFAAMPECRLLGQAQLYRPLLSQTRQALAELARESDLLWIEDPSNANDHYDRNYLRNRVLPILKRRWPDASERMERNARHGREAVMLLNELAEMDAACIVEASTGDLLLEPLLELSEPRQRNFIQWWLRTSGLPPLGEKQLLNALPEFLAARTDGAAGISGSGFVIRRYNGRAMVLNQALLAHRPESTLWQPPGELSWGAGQLVAERSEGEGLVPFGSGFTVRSRQGGEHIVLASGQRQPLKKWLQGRRIPPWERAALPLVWQADVLVAVGDLWIHPGYRAPAGQSGWVIRWQSPPFRARATGPDRPLR